MKTYLSRVSAGFSRMASVASPTVERSVKFVRVLPESKMVHCCSGLEVKA